MPNTFLAKAIESWLTKSNELGYTLPFCEVLTAQGFSVVHLSKQNAFEQGKDIIALRADELHAYQLKGGNITDDRWVREVWPEIEKLRKLPVVHPAVPAGTPHRSYLVTNGVLEDTVRRMITDLNNTQWAEAPLTVIVRGQLLRDFIDASEAFVPQELVNYRNFLDLIFSDGRGVLDEEKLTKLFEETLRLGDGELSKAARRRSITATVLYASYVLSAAAREPNHVAVMHGLAMLLSYILLVAERESLPPSIYRASVDLILDELNRRGASLEAELNAGELEKVFETPWDGTLGIFRRHLAVTYLTAHKLSQYLSADVDWNSVQTTTLLEWNATGQILWGEGAVAAFLIRFWLFTLLMPGDSTVSVFLEGPLRDVLKANSRDSETGLLSPYYGIDVAARLATGTLDREMHETFTGRSYSIGLLLDLLARYGHRKPVAQLWRSISDLPHTEYHPSELWEYFARRGESGAEVSRFPDQTQSWAKLVSDAEAVDLSAIPRLLRETAGFMPYFALCYPHHLTRNLVRYFDDTVRETTAPPLTSA
jgi:hypothetical protein